jgi:hypothetical protein
MELQVDEPQLTVNAITCPLDAPSPPTASLTSRAPTASGKDVHSLAVNGGLSDFEYASKAWLMAG